ncbi:MAG: 50S ribosomal protein L5 [Candidatus Roizmanbacteria bacterium]|nr:50S ribosomal protein L5 [Candidatus Roizmanbacteria bacterium]
MNDTEKKQHIETLKKKFGYKNTHELPNILKIIVNMGLNDALKDKGVIDKGSEQLTIITGQKPLTTIARKSISAFKLRKGVPIGLKVTLRGKRMFDFWEKLVRIVLPRMRDFRGISAKSFDGQGNLNLGFKEQGIFPDLDYDKMDRTRGIEITIVTSAKVDSEAKAFLAEMGMPFEK